MKKALCIIGFLLIANNCFALPAFPGAEGFGANSVGGRGGAVLKVTNLNDSGAGSFRAACTTAGARYVIFEVSGIIVLESTLTIDNPYITIAGETSPGGILVTGSTVIINSSNTIIRHMRFRVGSSQIEFDRDGGEIIYYDQPQYNFPPAAECLGNITTEALGYPCAITGGADPETLDSLSIYGGDNAANFEEATDIIIDHCSIGWGVDETFSTAYDPLNITISWSIIAESLDRAGHPKGSHGKGALFWNKYSPNIEVSFHHNYMAHNPDRNPLVNNGNWTDSDILDAANNVIYNWYRALGSMSKHESKVNWRHNYNKPGLNDDGVNTYQASHYGGDTHELIFMEGNLGAGRDSQEDAEWNIGVSFTSKLLSEDFKRDTAWTHDTVTTTSMSYSYALTILEAVGATKPSRDSVDTRIVNDFAAGTGEIINNNVYPDDYPTYSTPAYPTDSNSNGIADHWEVETFGGLVSATDDANSDGYDNLENYLHYLAGGGEASSPTTNATTITNNKVTISNETVIIQK